MNFEEELDKYFDTYFEIEPEPKHNLDTCPECGCETTRNEQKQRVCQACGVMSSTPVLEHYYCAHSRPTKRSIYNPSTHFSERLAEILGMLVPINPQPLMDIFQGTTVSNIHAVRRVLRTHGMTKHNKYTYYIYEMLVGEPVFKLSYPTQRKVTARFNTIYARFRADKTKIRKNAFSYYFILEKLLDEVGIPTKNRLPVPRVRQIVKRNNIQWNKYNY
jgi:predicted RNA-binding Zn-ribbon protein involved in translation (DUF1610 family)